MSKELNKEFHDRRVELELMQAYYIMEHKEPSEELIKSIKELRDEYKKQLTIEKMNEKEGDVKNVKH